jgi:pyroglutamyl-peptidase
MSLADIVRGVEAAIGAIVAFKGKEDVKNVGGATH